VLCFAAAAPALLPPPLLPLPSALLRTADEYNQKWEFQEPQQGVYTWEGGDAVYDFAVENDLMHR
jgi:hypothetical protein